MQKKILTGLLLLAVIGIWGYVGMRFFNGQGEDEDLFTEEIPLEENINIKIDKEQKLLLNYADPFLKSEVKSATKSNLEKPVIKPIIKKEEKPVTPSTNFNWPSVIYKGLIMNKNNPDKLLGVVILNGKERIIRKGEIVEELVVLNIEKSKVELGHEKEKREFRK